MKLWIVIWMSGEIGGVAGPLPYDHAECMRRADEGNRQIQEQIATGKDVEGNPVQDKARTLRWQCVEQPTRPKIGSTTLH